MPRARRSVSARYAETRRSTRTRRRTGPPRRARHHRTSRRARGGRRIRYRSATTADLRGDSADRAWRTFRGRRPRECGRPFDSSAEGTVGQQLGYLVRGQVSRPEGASFAWHTWLYVERRWRPRTWKFEPSG